ncbi:EamA family transporter [Chitinophaga ginsengisegetis]|uniref:DMT family transporter n=1 Tax=Chitinophaga ginsengisegetis TaxID=393003 RepID=UPI00342509DF
MKRIIISWGLLLLCNLMWALQFTCIKLVQDQVGPYFTVWAPMTMAVLLLLPFILRERNDQKRSVSDLLVFVRLGLLGAFPAQVLMTWGTQYSTATNAAVLTLSLPVISTLFAFLMLKEKMNPVRWVSFAVAIIGVVLCTFGDIRQADFTAGYTVGNLLIFLAIVGNAYYNTGCKAIASRYSEIEMVFYTYVVMIIFLTPLVLFYEPEVFGRIGVFTVQTWTGLALLTLFHNFLSMVLFFKALKTLDAMQVALSNYMITFMGLPIAAIWLGEALSGYAIAGGMLVLAGTLIVTIVDYRMSNHTAIIKN